MSRRDPSAADGAGVYPPLHRCDACTHLETVHQLDKGRRRGCHTSKCPCAGFVPGPVQDRCPTCGATWDALEAARRMP